MDTSYAEGTPWAIAWEKAKKENGKHIRGFSIRNEDIKKHYLDLIEKMQNKNITIKQLLDLILQKHSVLEPELREKPSLEYKKQQQQDQKQDLEEKQALENKKQQVEIDKQQAKTDNLTQHTEALKSATALKKRFTLFVLIYLCCYTLSVLITVWMCLFMNPQTPGIHYVLVALIGSLTVGLFSCVRATANGIFGESKNKSKQPD